MPRYGNTRTNKGGADNDEPPSPPPEQVGITPAGTPMAPVKPHLRDALSQRLQQEKHDIESELAKLKNNEIKTIDDLVKLANDPNNQTLEAFLNSLENEQLKQRLLSALLMNAINQNQLRVEPLPVQPPPQPQEGGAPKKSKKKSVSKPAQKPTKTMLTKAQKMGVSTDKKVRGGGGMTPKTRAELQRDLDRKA